MQLEIDVFWVFLAPKIYSISISGFGQKKKSIHMYLNKTEKKTIITCKENPTVV